MFERYNIVDNKDCFEAVAQREQKRIADASDISHNFSHNSPILAKATDGKKSAKVV